MDTESKIDKLFAVIYEGENGGDSMKVQLATIHQKLDNCPIGKTNRALITWLWAFVVGGGAGLLALVIRLHL